MIALKVVMLGVFLHGRPKEAIEFWDNTGSTCATSPDSEVELDDAVRPSSLAGSVEHANHAPCLGE